MVCVDQVFLTYVNVVFIISVESRSTSAYHRIAHIVSWNPARTQLVEGLVAYHFLSFGRISYCVRSNWWICTDCCWLLRQSTFCHICVCLDLPLDQLQILHIVWVDTIVHLTHVSFFESAQISTHWHSYQRCDSIYGFTALLKLETGGRLMLEISETNWVLLR